MLNRGEAITQFPGCIVAIHESGRSLILAAAATFACPETGYDPMSPINLKVRSEHNRMPNSCKADIEVDPSWVFRLPVTTVPSEWFRSDFERQRFFDIYK